MIAHNIPTSPAPIEAPELEQQLRSSLQATFFSGDRNSSPRRMGQIAREMAESFARYLSGHDGDEAVDAFGGRLAGSGIGHQSLLALVNTLHSIAWERCSAPAGLLPASVRYCHPLLAGYMRAREAYLLQEQERTRQALERARTQNGA